MFQKSETHRSKSEKFPKPETSPNMSDSYLTRRCQRIKLGDCLSSKADRKFGVPQGSVSGPLLFTLYTTPLSSMISGHAIPRHLYADDNQLHVFFASGDSAAALNGFDYCNFHFCMVSPTLTSQGFSVFRIDWPA